MMNYQEMTDFEINCEVSKVIGFEELMFFEVDSSICNGPVWTIASGWTDCGIPVSKGNPFDPCNSWSDAGPIIQESKIGIREYDGWWEARIYITEYAYCQKNPLRAAMIVFLMMKGGE